MFFSVNKKRQISFVSAVIIAVFLFFSSFNFLFSKTNLEEDLEKLRREVEEMELKYWRMKEASLKEKRKLSEAIDLLDQGLKTAYERRNSLTEEVFLALENLEKVKADYQGIKDERESFKANILEVVEKDTGRLKASHPRLIEDGIRLLSRISGEDASSVDAMVRGVVQYRTFLLKNSELIENYESKVVNEDTKTSVSANILRLGYIHSCYLAEDGSVGFLLRSSDLTGVHYSWVSKLPDDIASDIKLVVSAVEADKEQLPPLLRVPIDVSQVGRRARSLLENSEADWAIAVANFFRAGGVLMYPLFMVAFAAMIIVIERAIFFSTTKKKRGFKKKIFLDCLAKSDDEGAQKQLALSGKYCNEALCDLFLENTKKYNLETMEKHIESGIQAIAPKLEARLATLAVLGSIAPLLGLLGTVSGMIDLFDVITVYGTSNPKILAGGISIALITTQVGLSVAIPILLVHHFLKQYKNKIFDKIEEMGILIIEHKMSAKTK